MPSPRTEPNSLELLVEKILEVAEMKNDTDEGATVFMPDEEEWGEIVGLARGAVQDLLSNMERAIQRGFE